jgi:hypothetical protein
MTLSREQRAAAARAGHARSPARARKHRLYALGADLLTRAGVPLGSHFHGAEITRILERMRGDATDAEREAVDFICGAPGRSAAQPVAAFRMHLRRHPETIPKKAKGLPL